MSERPIAPDTTPFRIGDQPAGMGPRLALVGGVVAVEFAAIATVYLLAVDFDCTVSGSLGTCLAVRGLFERGLWVAVGLLLYVPARLWMHGGAACRARPWPSIQILGFLLIIGPALLAGGNFATIFPAAVTLWLTGATMATLGTLLWLAPWADWRHILRRDGAVPWVLLATALAAPDILPQFDRLWQWRPLTDATFGAVVATLGQVASVQADPANYLIAVDGFVVEIADPCSGIQGLALISALLIGYLYLSRETLRLPRALVLIPLGLAASFILNVVRIAMLMLIGARVSPELAVSGFHSHAGWLMFTLLAFALMALSRTVPWFRQAPSAGGLGLAILSRDHHSALIAPFIVLMLSSLVVSTFTAAPELWYPLQVAAVLLSVAVFAPCYLALDWRPDPLAAAAGLLVGLAWIATRPEAPVDLRLDAALAALPTAGFVPWLAARLLGTAILVPLIEESFFRGYLLGRLNRGGWTRPAALLVSAGLFAMLHDRWLAALLAGLVFGVLMQRRGRLADAVTAHAAANAVIAAWALAQANWAIT